jgi:hypothetical protein
MAQQQQRTKYKITNTTIKAPRLNADGVDVRKAIEKVGHGVSFRDDKNGLIAIHARDNPRIMNEVSEGMYRLQAGGLISIEEIDGVAAVLRDHAQSRTANAPVSEAGQPAKGDDGRRRAVVNEMGKGNEASSPESTQEYPGAVNPDGAPNFVVTAPNRSGNGKKDKQEKSSTLDAVPTGV